MNQSDAPQNQPLVEYQIDRVVDETSTETRIVVLSRKGGDPDAFPIWIGAAEGHAIKLALDATVTPRPMSHDLVKSFAEHLGVTVRRVVISDVRNSTYYATVHLGNNGVDRTLDARPSDALALAVRVQCPIYIAQDVLARRSTANLDAWLAKLESKRVGAQPEVREI
ncbi:MAG: bifunctional nuclease family protein [Nitrospira sp.]|nr:bifunctional nuclease family protein [Nitrospira sp.]